MRYLYAPWRGRYILGKKEPGCFICKAVKEENDEKNLVLYRGKHTIVLMNRYPYNFGHVLVAPKRHVANFEDLTDEEALEIFHLVKKFIEGMKRLDPPDGFNIGINLGKYAGASLEDHLHVHVVPRWKNDAAFMEILADTRVINFDIRESYQKLRKVFHDD